MLEITTFGGLSIRLNRQPVAGLDSRKVEALLVYLACTGRAHPREVLASMLWDEMPQDRAMGNLRGALSNLRKHLAPYLDIGRDTAGVNPAADIWLDLTKFEAGLFSLQDRQGISSPDLEQVGTAVNLYQGDFLAGFYVSGAREFDDWALRQRERMHILVVDALMDLVAHDLGRRDYKAGIQHATRWIAIDPLTEQAHQALMRLLALSGQREAALAQYEACRKVLREELGLEPTQGTRALADAIRRGELVAAGERAIAPAEAPLRWPAFLAVDAGTTAPPDVVFVGRARELEQLEHHLGAALDGSGRVVFIAGEAGRGKTALMDAFTTRSLGAHPDLLVASGHCNAYSGIGDPFLPFRDVLGILSAGVEARWSAGTISQELARRLWGALPDTIPLLVREGPELVGVFVSATALSSRAQSAGQGETGWAAQLSRLVELGPGKGGEVSQSQLFDQYTQVLRALSARHPLLIVLDDLQWADLATLTLLFHLGRRIEGSRILILGAYRPDEVALGRAGEPHPLNKPLAELQHYFGEIIIDLERTDETGAGNMIDAYLDSQPNLLSGAFRAEMLHRTQGHPLFMIELLREMQRRGDLVQDKEGRWSEGGSLNWDTLPAGVEAVIGQRVDRLDDELQELLSVACVEGEVFTAEVLARVIQKDERSIYRLLSRQLVERHRLVREYGELQLGERWLTQYKFSHILFQDYLYQRLGAGERRRLHADVARALEHLHQPNLDEVVLPLAQHYAIAGERSKTIEYACLAASRAQDFYAHAEAIQHLQQALDWLKPVEEDNLRASILEQSGDNHVLLGERPQAIQLYQEALALMNAMDPPDRMAVVRLHRKVGETVLYMSQFADREQYQDTALTNLELGRQIAAREPPNAEIVRLLTTLSYTAWYQRYPADWDLAEQYARSAVTMAEQLDSPIDLSAAFDALGNVYGARGLFRERLEVAQQRLALSRGPHFQAAREKALILHEVGFSFLQVGEYAQAIPYLLECERFSTEIQDFYQQYEALNELARCWFHLDHWDRVLEIDQKRRELERKYIHYSERIGPTCYLLGLVASVHALRGQLDQSTPLREESRQMMIAQSGPPEGWARHNFY